MAILPLSEDKPPKQINAPQPVAAASLSKEDFAARAGVPVSQVITDPSGTGFVVGPSPTSAPTTTQTDQTKIPGYVPPIGKDVNGNPIYNNIPGWQSVALGPNNTWTDSGGNTFTINSDGSRSPVSSDKSATGTSGTTGGATGDFGQSALDNETNTAWNDFHNIAVQYGQGALPLTADQQASIDALRATYDQLHAKQLLLNQNYQGGVEVAGVASGLSRYAPGQAMGLIYKAASDGLAKITAIDTEALGKIADLRQAFETKNYQAAKDAYDEFNKFADKKQAEIDKVVAAGKQAIKDAEAQKQQQFDNMMASEKFTYQQKQDAIDNAFKQDQINETQRHNMVTELNAGQAGNLPGSHPPVKMTADNTPDKSQQASFLQSLGNPDLATLIKGIAEYNINPASVPTRNYRGVGGLTQSQVLSLVMQYDPSFTQTDYAARQALNTAFKSGKYSQNINALNTAIGHIVDIQGNFSSLGNINFTPYNAAKNAVENLFGAGGIPKANLNIQAATGELAMVFKNAGASDQEIKNLGVLSTSSSPNQVKAYIETATQLLASRLQALDDTYTSGMGKSPDKSFLSPTSQESLLKLQQQGLDIKVPELTKSPIIQLQTFHDADPKNATLMDGIIANHPELKNDPNAMVDYLAQNGITL